jgi:hypothetical protein
MEHAVQSRRYQSAVQEVVRHLDAHKIRFHTKHTQKPPSFLTLLWQWSNNVWLRYRTTTTLQYWRLVFIPVVVVPLISDTLAGNQNVRAQIVQSSTSNAAGAKP